SGRVLCGHVVPSFDPLPARWAMPRPAPIRYTRHHCKTHAPAGAAMAFFTEVKPIRYEGPDSTNPLAFRHYNPEERAEGKTLREWLRFSVPYWHPSRGTGSDPFGPGCARRPWEDGTDSVEMAEKRVHVAFEFMEKLGSPFYCFHDRDVAPEGKNLKE